MKAKTILTALLGLFVLVSVIYLAVHQKQNGTEQSSSLPGNGTITEEKPPQSSTPEIPGASSTTNASTTQQAFINVYYFHGTKRCQTCLGMEQMTQDALRFNFASQLKDGSVKFQTVNYDEPSETHFKQDFNVSFSTVVMAQVEDGKVTRFKNCENVWDYAHNPSGYEEYIVKELRGYLNNEECEHGRTCGK